MHEVFYSTVVSVMKTTGCLHGNELTDCVRCVMFRVVYVPTSTLSIMFTRLLLDSYLNQRICAAWDACKSDFVQATNGVNRAVSFRQYC